MPLGSGVPHCSPSAVCGIWPNGLALRSTSSTRPRSPASGALAALAEQTGGQYIAPRAQSVSAALNEIRRTCPGRAPSRRHPRDGGVSGCARRTSGARVGVSGRTISGTVGVAAMTIQPVLPWPILAVVSGALIFARLVTLRQVLMISPAMAWSRGAAMDRRQPGGTAAHRGGYPAGNSRREAALAQHRRRVRTSTCSLSSTGRPTRRRGLRDR